MNAIPFDTLKMARKLEASGFSGDQAAGAAEAMADAMSGAELATKADLMSVKTDLFSVRTDLERKIDQVRTDLERKIDQVRTELKTEIGQVRTDLTHEIGQVRTDLTHEIGQVRTDLTHEIGQVRTDLTHEISMARTGLEGKIIGLDARIELLRRDLTIRLGAMIFAGTGIMLAAMRYMLAHP